MLRTILIGYGHAARDLHLPALRKLGACDRHKIGAVEPILIGQTDVPADVHLCAGIEQLVSHYPPPCTVVHVCTPPDQHLAAVAVCAEHGYRRFVVEKPMVVTREDVDALLTLIAQRDLDVLVVANWLSSRLTDAIAEQLFDRRDVPLAGVEFISRKPRISRSLESGSHVSVFHVEMPHLVALAVRLLGDVELLHARASDLATAQRRIPMMGGAEMWLRSLDGCDVRLETDLCSPARERSVTVTWADGVRIDGNFPCDSTDLFSHLRVNDRAGVPSHSIVHDDTVWAFFERAYRWFEGRGPRPRSDAILHARVTELLVAAQERCAATRAAPTIRLTEITT